MTIQILGTLPVSSINLGLTASISALNAEIAKLQLDLSKLALALEAQVSFSLNFPPNLPGFALQFAAALDVAALTSAFNPLNWVSLNVDANADLAIELGLIEAQLAIVAGVEGQLGAGLNSGSLAGWTYAGRAAGFGTTLEAHTARGFGGIGPDENINAVLVGCADFDSWVSFSAGFNTGASDDTSLGSSTDQERLHFMGVLGGAQWNTGVQDIYARIELLLLELEALQASIAVQIQLSLGFNLPDPTVIVDAGLDIDLDLALENIVNVQVDLDAQLELFQLKIDLILGLIVELNAQLSAGGLTVWSYSGTAGQLGAEFAAAIADGLPNAGGPNAPAYGLAIACASPSAWASFGNIFIG